jgi:hypothetical protein
VTVSTFMRPLAIQTVLTALLLISASTLAEPLPTTNQNPYLASIGLPAPLPMLAAGQTQVATTLNWGSTAIVDVVGDELFVLDAETRELRLAVTHAFNNRLSVRVELPYLYTGPGVLDGFIDDFHDLFGFSEGDRPLFQRDQMLAWYRRSGEPSFVIRSSSTEGVGDLAVSLGAKLIQSEKSSLATWLSVEAPTGSDDAYLAADDDWNLSATIAAQHRFGTRWLTFAQASATTHTGEGVFGEQQALIWSGFGGVQFDLTPRIAFLVQGQAHTQPIKHTDIDYLSDAVVLTVGGHIQATDAVRIHLGVSEDLKVEASPDVVFVLGLSTTW